MGGRIRGGLLSCLSLPFLADWQRGMKPSPGLANGESTPWAAPAPAPPARKERWQCQALPRDLLGKEQPPHPATGGINSAKQSRLGAQQRPPGAAAP